MRVLRCLIYVTISLLLLLFVFEVVIVLLLKLGFVNINRSAPKVEVRSHEYQIYQYSPLTNRSFGGFATVAEEIEDDFETFQNENGDWTMISKIGLQEFKCSGQCYCEDSDGEKRRSVVPRVVKSGLIFLVAGATSIVAYNRASEYFKEKCQEEVHFTCSPPSTIYSSVETCFSGKIEEDDDFYMSEDDDFYEPEEEEEQMDLFGEKVPKKEIKIDDPWEDSYKFNYWCKGFCKVNKLTSEQSRMIELVVENFGFELPEFSRRFCTGGGKEPKRKLELPVQFEEKDPDYKFKEISYTKKTFRYNLLNPFCQKMGIFERDLYLRYFDELDDSILDDLCIGDHTSIKCKEFDPETLL